MLRMASHSANVVQPGRGRLDGPEPSQTLSGLTHSEFVWWSWRRSGISARFDLGFILIVVHIIVDDQLDRG